MRKFLGFLALLALLFVLGSFFMPTKLQLKRQITILNNKAVVYNKVQDLKVFKDWLEEESKKNVQQKEESVFWKEQGRRFRYQIKERKPQTEVVASTQELKSKQNFSVKFTIDAKSEKQTELTLEVHSVPTLNPILRYSYGFDKKKIAQVFEDALAYLKEMTEKVHYERFYLSNPSIVYRDDTVFSLMKQTIPINLRQVKDAAIDSLLMQRLVRYRMLDTTQSSFLQYADWSDSLVQYNVCIPVLRLPTKKQSLWLHTGKIAFVRGQFFTSTFEGASQDLPLAWDSLRVNLAKRGKVAEGLPLEQLIQKTDSTETRRLFIRLR